MSNIDKTIHIKAQNMSMSLLTPLKINNRERGTSSDLGHAGDFGPHSGMLRKTFGGGLSARKVNEC
jgi:hypothetical protein